MHAEEVTFSLNQKILSPKRDTIFKKMFGTWKNRRFLMSFLRAVLGFTEDELADIEFLNTEQLPEHRDGKFGRIDILVKLKSGEQIHVEIQVGYDADIREREVLYHSRIFGDQLLAGETYGDIQKVVSILITDFDCIKDSPGFMHVFTFSDLGRGVELTDKSTIVTLEMSKLDAVPDEEKLVKWLKFIRAEEEEEFKMVASTDSEIQEAFTELRAISADPAVRYAYFSEVKEHMRIQAREHFAREEGLQEGIQQGIQALIQTGAKYGASKLDIAQDVSEQYNLTLEEATSCVNQYYPN